MNKRHFHNYIMKPKYVEDLWFDPKWDQIKFKNNMI